MPTSMSKTIDDHLATRVPSPADEAATPGLPDTVQQHIGNMLRVSFQELLAEPVPDRFSQLLEQLEQAEKGKVK